MKQKQTMAIALGYGSDREVANRTRDHILDNTDYDDVVVFSLDDGMNRPDDVAEAMDGAAVWLHSDGAETGDQALRLHPSVRPSSANLVATPIPTPEGRLILGAGRVLVNETRSSLSSVENARTNLLHTVGFCKEVGRHAIGQISVIRRIAHYDSFELGNRLAEQGIDTRMCAMESDEFFDLRSLAFQRRLAEKHRGLEVISLSGGHCEFAQRPVATMARMATAQMVTLRTLSEPEFSGSLELSQGLVPA